MESWHQTPLPTKLELALRYPYGMQEDLHRVHEEHRMGRHRLSSMVVTSSYQIHLHNLELDLY